MVIDVEKLEKAAFILKTIAHPTRLCILQHLGDTEELTVKELCEKSNCEQSLASHHLNNMKNKGIISSRKEGKFIYYRLKERDVLKVLDCIENCDCNF